MNLVLRSSESRWKLRCFEPAVYNFTHNANRGKLRNVMADGRVKTLQVFSRVETDRNAIIKSIKLGKRREVILVSSGDEFLHFLEGEKLLQVSIQTKA